ncbi:hypothetical protein B0H22_11333, partial [Methanohalophilus euhalobius]
LKHVFDAIISLRITVTGYLLDVKNVVMRTMPT